MRITYHSSFVVNKLKSMNFEKFFTLLFAAFTIFQERMERPDRQSPDETSRMFRANVIIPESPSEERTVAETDQENSLDESSNIPQVLTIAAASLASFAIKKPR